MIVELQKGDILGHEFCGIVDSVGPAVKNVKVGDRVVGLLHPSGLPVASSFPPKTKRTNANTIQNTMYGGRNAGMFGYSHFTGGFMGGQAEYARVPFGDVNLLHLPDDVTCLTY